MPEHDLTFVAPERRAEVLRRIDVVERFLEAPGRASAEAHAAELGLRVAQFYLLARAWRETRRPDALAGAGRPKTRRLEITTDQADLMDRVISAEARGTTQELVHYILDQARATGTPMPGRETVTRYVLRSRPARLPSAKTSSPDLIVDHTVLDLPVTFDGIARRPLATMLIDGKEEMIVGIALSEGHPSPSATATAMLDALRNARRYTGAARGTAPSISHPVDGNGEWTLFDDDLTRSGIAVQLRHPTPYQNGLIVEALLGRRCGGLRLRPRLVRAGLTKRRPAAGRAVGMDPNDAVRLVRSRIVGSRSTAAFATLDPVTRLQLEDRLSRWSLA